MINGNLEIKVLSFDEGDGLYYYRIILSNGITTGCLEFYGYSDVFKDFGSQLMLFPKNIRDTVIFDIDKDNYLKVYCYDVNGHSVLNVQIDNYAIAPHHNRCEFSIKTIPASINKLGEALYVWHPMLNNPFKWDFTD